MFYYTYVLRSEVDGKLYIGSTNDLKRRFREHNNGEEKSTKVRAPFELIYFEGGGDLAKARKREKYFKTGYGRRFLKNRI